MVLQFSVQEDFLFFIVLHAKRWLFVVLARDHQKLNFCPRTLKTKAADSR